MDKAPSSDAMTNESKEKLERKEKENQRVQMCCARFASRPHTARSVSPSAQSAQTSSAGDWNIWWNDVCRTDKWSDSLESARETIKFNFHWPLHSFNWSFQPQRLCQQTFLFLFLSAICFVYFLKIFHQSDDFCRHSIWSHFFESLNGVSIVSK